MSNNLSKQLQVGKAEGLVTYRLIGAGSPDPLTGKPMFRSGFVLPGVATIYDPGDEQGNYNKTLRNITGQSTDASGKINYDVDGITFDHTNTISVRPEQFHLYEFLERHPRNASNPYHDKTKAPLFERLDFVAMAKAAMKDEDTLYEAVGLARSMSIYDLVDYARSLQINVDRDAEEIRFDMVRKAKENPAKFIKESGSIVTKTRSRLAIAQEEGIIIWQAASRSWNFKGGDGPFLVVAPGEPQFDALVDFVLRSRDGELVLKTIERRLGIEPTEAAPVITAQVTAPVEPEAKSNKPKPRTTAKSTPAKKPASKAKATKKAADTPATDNTGSESGTEA